MDASPQAPLDVAWRRHLPWLHLLRAFRIAVDPRKMLLAGSGLLLLALGDWVLIGLPFAPADAIGAAWPWEQPSGWDGGSDLLLRLEMEPAETVWSLLTNWSAVLRPAAGFVEPVLVLLQSPLGWSSAAYAITRLLWTLLVWGLFGGAITRMAALQFARDEKIGIGPALKFAAARLLSYATAPLLPLAGIGFFWLLCLAGGLVGRIPGVGELIVGALWIVPLVFGALMTLILIGVAAGWPLMYSTISVEGSDAFDGLSRSYSYVFDRPWHYLGYAAVATLLGSIVIFFVTLLFASTVYLAGWAVGSGMGGESMARLSSLAPASLGGTPPLVESGAAPPGAGARLAGGWLHFAALLQAGFVYSYFWTATTIIYFLLRKSDDAIDFEEIHLPDQTDEDELLPLVGVADSEQPVIERPPAEVPASED